MPLFFWQLAAAIALLAIIFYFSAVPNGELSYHQKLKMVWTAFAIAAQRLCLRAWGFVTLGCYYLWRSCRLFFTGFCAIPATVTSVVTYSFEFFNSTTTFPRWDQVGGTNSVFRRLLQLNVDGYTWGYWAVESLMGTACAILFVFFVACAEIHYVKNAWTYASEAIVIAIDVWRWFHRPVRPANGPHMEHPRGDGA